MAPEFLALAARPPRAPAAFAAHTFLALAAVLLVGCTAAPLQTPAPSIAEGAAASTTAPLTPSRPPALSGAAGTTLAASAPQAPASASLPATASTALLAYADRLRTLSPPELGQEISRLGDGNGQPTRQLQLALALLQTQQAADGQRAQGLLQKVLGTEDAQAQALHPLARLILAQQAGQRRLEDQVERQAQQLRDSQRRIDQLSDRLDALRAIERSLPSRPVR